MIGQAKDEVKTLLLIPPSFLFPMGPAYVAATLERAGYPFDIYAFLYDNRCWFRDSERNAPLDQGNGSAIRWIAGADATAELQRIIHRRQYDYILTGGLVGFFRWFYNVLPPLKGYSPGSLLILGGGMTKDVAAEMLFRHLPIDYALAGEAETNLSELLQLLESGVRSPDELAAVPGLICKDGAAGTRKNPVRRLDLERTDLLPAWDLFPIEEYIRLSDTLLKMEKTFFPILVGRGCPNVCAFCSPSVGRFQARPLDAVLGEMSHWNERHAFDFFFIYSEVAFEDEEFTREFCTRVKTEIGRPWVGQLRTDVEFSVDTYRLMKESGCMFICLGFESACDRVLKAMNKRTTVADHLRNLTRAKEAGLRVFGNFMFGHDQETAEEIHASFAFLDEHKLINTPANGLASIIIYPGTKYYRTAKDRGLVGDELQFLLTYSLRAGIASADIREVEEAGKLNISALTNDRFYETICNENIRFRRAFNRRHRLLNVSRRFAMGATAGFTYRGTCPECGTLVEFAAQETACALDVAKVCPGCYFQVNVDVFAFAEMAAHLSWLKSELERHEHIVVYGPWNMQVLFSGALEVPADRIVAWIDPWQPKTVSRRYFYHYPVSGSNQLEPGRCDVVLCTWPRIVATMDLALSAATERGIPLLNVFPDELNPAVPGIDAGSQIAMCGDSLRIRDLIRQLSAQAGRTKVAHFPQSEVLCSTGSLFDLVVVDPRETTETRQTVALTSTYRIDQVLYPEHLAEGGLYCSLDFGRERANYGMG